MADVADLPSMKQFAAKEVGSSGWSHFEETRKNSEKKIVIHLRRKKTELDLQIQKAKTPAVPGNRPWPSAREISVDLLAKEWMVLTNPSIEARLYLLDNILPSVIMSLEKLCIEVSKRQLEGSEHVTSRFNPINYLAQHLMRNNPKYSNFAEASPYMKGLQQMVTKLKADVMSLEENKLVKMKVEARRRREDRLKLESIKKEAERGKKERLKQVFKEWLIPNETAPELAQVRTHLLQTHPPLTDTPTSYRHTHLLQTHPPLTDTPTSYRHTHLIYRHTHFMAVICSAGPTCYASLQWLS